MINVIKEGFKKMVVENKSCFNTFSEYVNNHVCDRRYKLKFKSGTCSLSNIIVVFKGVKYYCYLDYGNGGKIKDYKVEICKR